MSTPDQTDKKKNPFLRIAAYRTGISMLGPGLRSAVWVQGCPFHCPGCIAPDWLPFNSPALEISPKELCSPLLANPQISGLTLSGGEPFAQAEALAALVSLARQKRELDIICFSGYRFEALLNNPPNPGVFALLDQIDVLIDGAYIEAQNDGRGMRGSNNQRIIHFTNRLRGYDFENQPRRAEIVIQSGGMFMVGVPPKNVLFSLDKLKPESFDQFILKATSHERA